MDIRHQTQVPTEGRIQYYQYVYPAQTEGKDKLIQIDQLASSHIIMIDSCGWYYKQCWPDLHVTSIENSETIRNFKLPDSYYDKIVDLQPGAPISWPVINISDCTLVFDRCVFLRYINVNDLCAALSSAAIAYDPQSIVLSINPTFIDDNRIEERINSLSQIRVSGYVIDTFSLSQKNLTITYRKKIHV